MKRTAFRWLVTASVLALALMPAWARTRPRFGGTLRVEMRGDTAQWRGNPYQLLVFDTLTQADGAGHTQPALAARWDSQNDARRWQFWLRPGVRFHDGTPLSPATVVQSLTAGECPECPWKSVRVLGDSVLFESDVSLPELPALLASPLFAISRNDPTGVPVGTGPFRIASAGNGVVVLQAAEDGWRGQPFVSGIEIRGGRQLRDQWLDLGVGRADLVEVPAEQIRRAQNEHMKVLVSRNVDLIAIVADGLHPVVKDAISSSIDRASLLNVIFQKQGEVTGSVLPNWLTGYSFLRASAPDIAHARTILAAFSVPDISVASENAGGVFDLAADRIVLNLRDGGMLAHRVASLQNGANLRLVRIPITSASPAAAYDEILGGFRRGKPSSLPSQFASTEEVAVLYQAEQQLLAERTIIPLLYVPRACAISGRLRDLTLAPDGSLRDTSFWLEDGK